MRQVKETEKKILERFFNTNKIAAEIKNKEDELLYMEAKGEELKILSSKIVDNQYFEVAVDFFQRGERKRICHFRISEKEMMTRDGEIINLERSMATDLLGYLKTILTYMEYAPIKEFREKGEKMGNEDLIRITFIAEREKILYTIKKMDEIKKTYRERMKRIRDIAESTEEEWVHLQKETLLDQQGIFGVKGARKKALVTSTNNELYRTLPIVPKDTFVHDYIDGFFEQGMLDAKSRVMNESKYSAQERFAFLLDWLLAITEQNMRLETPSLEEISDTESITESFEKTFEYHQMVGMLLKDKDTKKIQRNLVEMYLKKEAEVMCQSYEEVERDYMQKQKKIKIKKQRKIKRRL